MSSGSSEWGSVVLISIDQNFRSNVWEGVGTSKIRTSKGQNVESIFRMIRTSKNQIVKNQNVKNQNVKNQEVKNQNVKNQNVENNVESQKVTFDILIFFDAIAYIRTSKVLVHFLA